MIHRDRKIIRSPAGKPYIIKDINVVPTGIEELDKLLVRHSQDQKPGVDIPGIYMIGGGPGTGKTLLALTLARKACESGAAPIYFTVEETTSELIRAAKKINIDIEKCIEEGRMAIVEFAPRKGLADESPYIISYESIADSESLEQSLIDTLSIVMGDLESPSHYVLIFDSLPALTSVAPNIHKRDFLRVLKSSSNIAYSLTRVITEADFTVEQYVTKGIILLNAVRTVDGFVRYMLIPKMRARAHYTGPVPFDITTEGLKIYLPGTKEFEERIKILRERF